ncbi:ABC transporter substrate-binding protein [Azospirillum brasilense]|uniref:ABC transporter substrate-binding protein n=3 Tax=Azospirillum TaxID=191 RepID=A0A0P0ELE3_AZOBR|nr:ABC transporter substrate-binding protein [Azospirillum brasilense]ALJ36825.1 ABC transporter permease [Azospirillum brasilense]MDW7555875.1 ABC transporter substrate-binding protein [Azospirillum brasilense]MDW7595952.1 ABC transporter substrate-binding protein [Azospirillum brasilense]MDW7630957.1 ABC transporter substrate-binding protein [Azospirillum brasilense]MDX5951563.1 ABC transporter substrate-binding protein [Azospirillum brasilense]
MLKTLLCGTALLALTAGAAHAQVSNNVIKIGVMNDRSGIYADLAGEGSAIAARLAAEEFGGKIAGAPIEIVVADHQNKADIAANTAREWIDAGNVDVIADVPNSAAALAVQGITKDKKRIFLMSGPGSTDLSGKSCSPYGFQWTYDNYAMAAGTARALVEQGKKNWFFITADYAFGHSLEDETTKMVKQLDGKVAGNVRHPLGTADFSSYLLQAQASKADVIGLANAGGDATNAVKQASEFGITQSGQSLAGLLLFISDVNALGLQAAQGLLLTTGFYWDTDDQTREWTKKFEAKAGRKPTMVQAGVYSAVRHYLKAVEAVGSDDPDKVAAKMRETTVEDMFTKNGKIAANGRMFHDMYLAQVKTPAESKGPWDYYKIVKTIPAEQAFLDPAKSGCSLVK